MTKQEIEKQIKRTDNLIATLEPWLSETVDIKAELLSQLKTELEAEKPKRRHGDFGMNMLLFKRIVINGDIFNESGELVCSVDEPIGNKCEEIWLGNIFDLLKNDEFIKLIATLKGKQS